MIMTTIYDNMVLNQSLEINQDGTSNFFSDGTSDLLQGAGSKKYTLTAASNAANPIIKLGESDFGDYTQSMLIENLVIDGDNKGVTGILLDNVVACMIRNITIKNCDVGIHLHNHDGLWSECSYLKHIRMENVKKGILFTGSDKINDDRPGDSAAFTTIDDVDIELKDVVGAVGIQVGDDTGAHFIKPYSSRMKANVRMGGNGTGLKVKNGEITFAQAHLTVVGTPNGNGVGVDVSNDSSIWHNQFSEFNLLDSVTKKGFMLVTSGIGTPINSTKTLDIITKTF